MTNNTQNATLAVSLMDLTSLNTDDSQASINALVNSINPNTEVNMVGNQVCFNVF